MSSRSGGSLAWIVTLRWRERANASASACRDGGKPVSAPARSKATTFGSSRPHRVHEPGDLQRPVGRAHGAADDVGRDRSARLPPRPPRRAAARRSPLRPPPPAPSPCAAPGRGGSRSRRRRRRRGRRPPRTATRSMCSGVCITASVCSNVARYCSRSPDSAPAVNHACSSATSVDGSAQPISSASSSTVAGRSPPSRWSCSNAFGRRRRRPQASSTELDRSLARRLARLTLGRAGPRRPSRGPRAGRRCHRPSAGRCARGWPRRPGGRPGCGPRR